jgi:hypothetical protein
MLINYFCEKLTWHFKIQVVSALLHQKILIIKSWERQKMLNLMKAKDSAIDSRES